MNKEISYFKKALVMLMAVMMIFTMMPSMAWADGENTGTAAGVGANQGENQAAETFQGTAAHGYVEDISFGDAKSKEDEKIDAAMNYTFNPAQTEYSLTLTDAFIGYMQFKGMESVSGKDYRADLAYYDDTKKEWIRSESLEFSTIINDIMLPTETMTYDRPTVIRLAVGPTKLEGTTPRVDLEQADIYYYSITREAGLTGINAGMDYPISPAFDKCGKTNTYYVYGSFDEDTAINLTLSIDGSLVAKKNTIYVNDLPSNGKFSAKYLELWSDTDGKKYVKIEVKHPAENGEEEIQGRSYRVYFLNEQKVNFITQPVGGTFEPQTGKFQTLTVNVDKPEGADIKYIWMVSSFSAAGWSPFRPALSSVADMSTRTTANLKVKLSKAGKYRFYCQVTLTIDGIDYVANSETVDVYIVKDGKISGPSLSSSSVMIPRTYYQDENAVQLTAMFSPVDAGVDTTMQWYVSKNEDGTDAKEVPSEAIIGTVTSGCNGAVTPDTSKTGTFYYYCKGTCTLTEEGQTYTAETKSDIIKIEVKPINVGLKGDGSEANPYLIESYDDLLKVKKAVNEAGITFANRYFKLTADEITLPADWEGLGREDKDKWAPYISGFMPFSGTILGCNNLIKMERGCRGFIKIARDAVVKDLNLYGEEITASALVTDLVVDYGLDRQYATGCPSPITAENVTLKSGSRTKESGLVGGGSSSGANTVNIRNCTIEEGVTVGYDKDRQSIGSFINNLNGIIINSTSAADVYGTSVVGGLAGGKGQSMGLCQVLNSSFTGSITATGTKVGGIMGCGYESESAPNTPVVSIINCYVDANITGRDYIGGIFGSEGGVINCWDNGVGSIDNNSFCGTITATKSDAKYVGGIVGFLRSFNKNQGIDTNYYLDTCGTDKGVGMIQTLYTTGTNAVEKGFDVEKCCIKASEAAFKNGTVLKGLQAGKRSYKNWIQGGNYPVHSGETVLYAIELSGDYKTEYKTGETFNTEGMVITGKLSDGSKRNISVSDSGVTFTGFKSNQRGVQTITVSYGVATATYEILVLYNDSQVKDGLVAFITVLGDSEHDEPDAAGGPHTLSEGNLPQTWVPRTKVTINNNTTVYDVIKQVLGEANLEGSANNKYSTMYISGVKIPGTDRYLSEFSNGNFSGWMYTLNGHHPNLGVAQQFLQNNDEIVFHYTDDYTKEEGSDKWNTPGADEVKNVTTSGAAGSASTTAPTEVKVSGTTATATIKAENQSEILKQAAEKKSAEIILEVSKADSKGADSVQLSLDVTFVKNVADKTNADLTVNTENGKVTLDQETIKAVLAETKGATITLEVSKVSKPTEVQKKAAGANGHLLKLTIKSGDKVISDFNKGKVKVVAEIVSKLLDKKVAAIHIADDGKIEQLAGKVLTIGGKKYYEFTTPHFSTFALVDADELGLEVKEEPAVDVKTLTAKLTPVARSAKTAKKNVKVTVSLDKQDKAIIKELKDAGYTVKYRFYRSTKKAAGYKAAVTKKTTSYTNTSGKKGTKYFYKVQVRVYDENGKLTAKTALKQCKYAARTWTK